MKKIIGLVLVIVMICSSFAGLQITSYALAGSGKCGDNVKWTFNSSTGLLTISGSGYMMDYDSGNDGPKSPFADKSEITKVVVSNGIYSIGDYAFMNCSKLTEISISASVDKIGWSVFYGCDALTTISINSGNTVYDSRNNCNAIIEKSTNKLVAGCKNTTIPSTVTSIAHMAFNHITTLTKISIPSSVVTLEGSPYYSCTGITSISVNSNNKKFDSRNSCNAIIEKSSNTLVLGCQNTVIPNTVTTIGSGAFSNCSGLTSITIPNSVTYIDYAAFERCTGLKSITIPGSVTSIGECTPIDDCKGSVFENCTGLEEVIFENGVKRIGERAFYNCNSLRSVTLPQSVSTLGGWAFCSCSKLEKLIILNNQCNLNTNYIDSCMFIPSSTALCGYSGSTAETYANKFSRDFIDLDLVQRDVNKPTLSYSFDNTTNTYCKISLQLNDDTSIAGYYFGKNNNYLDNTLYNGFKFSSSVNADCYVYDSGTYYLTAKDISDKVSETKSISFYQTKFDANGGTVSKTSVLAQSGKSFTLPTPSNGEYTFLGWYDSVEGGNKVSNNYTVNKNATLYAHWSSTAHSHTWDSVKITQSATCIATGVKTYTCTGCGMTKTETIAKTPHSWDNGVETQFATCQKTGIKTFTCSVCKTNKTEIIPITGHSYYRKMTPAIVGQRDGLIETLCTTCDQVFNTEIVYSDLSYLVYPYNSYYTGKVHQPQIWVTYLDYVIDPEHYDVSYIGDMKSVGVHKIVITFKGRYLGQKVIDYTIQKAPKTTTLKKGGVNASALKLTWSGIRGIAGYQLQISNAAGNKWDKSVTLKAGVTTYTFKKLSAGLNYKFRIRTYVIGEDRKTYYSSWSKVLSCTTLPSGTTLTKLTAGKKAFTAQWKKASFTGYQIQYSTNAKFSKAKIVTLKNAKTLKTTVKKLNAKKVYYVRIRTYKTILKANYFSTWSKTYKVKTK